MIRRPAVLLVAGLVATLTVTACGAGQGAQTYHERTTVDATNESLGSLALRNLVIQAPSSGPVLAQGTDATMQASFVNEGVRADQLVSATTDAAQSVTFTQDGATKDSIAVPAQGLSDTGAALTLVGLTRSLRVGQYVTVTLSFAVNGRKDLLVPVDSQLDQFRVTPTPTTSESPDPTLGDQGQKGATVPPPG